jgi:hypothetical protein
MSVLNVRHLRVCAGLNAFNITEPTSRGCNSCSGRYDFPPCHGSACHWPYVRVNTEDPNPVLVDLSFAIALRARLVESYCADNGFVAMPLLQLMNAS